MKADRNTIKTQYLLLVLPSSKKRFQKIKMEEDKTAWELFEEMLNAYEEKKRNQVAARAV